MGCHQAHAAEQAAWRSAGERPTCPQWHLLGLTLRSALARSARSVCPYTTCYNRFVRWQRAGVWSRIIDALAGAHDAAVKMIDTSVVRVHQHGACITRNQRQKGAWANTPPKSNRSDPICFSPYLYRALNRSSGSSIGSNNVAGWRPAMTGSPPTTLPSSNSHLSGLAGRAL